MCCPAKVADEKIHASTPGNVSSGECRAAPRQVATFPVGHFFRFCAFCCASFVKLSRRLSQFVAFLGLYGRHPFVHRSFKIHPETVAVVC